LAPFLCMK